jgi:apolipoprotein D and lipocalin family protein
MQFFWPIKADYRVVYLDENYQYTIIARNKKDYAWVMSRNPNISKQKRQELLDFVASLGYKIEAFSLHH